MNARVTPSIQTVDVETGAFTHGTATLDAVNCFISDSPRGRASLISPTGALLQASSVHCVNRTGCSGSGAACAPFGVAMSVG